MSELEGRVAIVTGAAQGIGRAIAVALGRAGARVAICDVVDETAAAGTVAEAGAQASYHRCDVTDLQAVERTVKEVVERHGGLHILVNNAGIAIDGLLLRSKQEDWAKVLQVNLTGAFNFARAAARHLLKAKELGRIINIASVVGEAGSAGQVAYAASKAGLLGMTKTLAQELAPRGVTVNAVSPGFIETRMTEVIPVVIREVGRRLNSLSQGGLPQDVAEAALFLASPDALGITGSVLRVCGQSLLGA